MQTDDASAEFKAINTPWQDLGFVERALADIVTHRPDATVRELAAELTRLERTLAAARGRLETAAHMVAADRRAAQLERVVDALLPAEVPSARRGLARAAQRRGPARPGQRTWRVDRRRGCRARRIDLYQPFGACLVVARSRSRVRRRVERAHRLPRLPVRCRRSAAPGDRRRPGAPAPGRARRLAGRAVVRDPDRLARRPPAGRRARRRSRRGRSRRRAVRRPSDMSARAAVELETLAAGQRARARPPPPLRARRVQRAARAAARRAGRPDAVRRARRRHRDRRVALPRRPAARHAPARARRAGRARPQPAGARARPAADRARATAS